MTTLWADGFEDTANTGTALADEYTTFGASIADATGRRAGTKAVSLGNSAYLQRTLGSSPSTLFASCAINPTTLAANNPFLQFNEGSTNHVAIGMDATGKITAFRNLTTSLGTSASAYFTAVNWAWIQVKVVIHDTTGSVEVRDASGAVLLNLSGIDTRNAATGICDNVKLVAASTTSTTLFDDSHVWDATGTICNTWTNDTRIDSILPSAAGASTQFTPSAGANYDAVNEAQWNSTDYVDSSTAGHQDLYAFADLPHSPVSIFAVLRTAVAQKDDAGARSLKLLTRRAATTYAGSAQTLNQGSYVRLTDVQETDPSTSVAWTPANLNAAEFGFENV